MTREQNKQRMRNEALNKLIKAHTGGFKVNSASWDQESYHEQRDDYVNDIIHELLKELHHA